MALAAMEHAAVLEVIGPLHSGSPITWYATLNNNTSTKPQTHGGKSVESMGRRRVFERAASGAHTCTLALPYATRTGYRRLEAVGTGNTQKEASEACCQEMVAKMLAADPESFTFRPKHWSVEISRWRNVVVEQVNDVLVQPVAQPVALPVHHRAPTGPNGGGRRGRGMDLADRDAEAAALIRRILVSHGGEFNPAQISHQAFAGGDCGVRRAYEQLDELLQPGELWPLVEASEDFECVREGNQMLIRWATAPAASGAILALENAPPAPTADTAAAAAPAAPAPAPAPADGAVPGGQQREMGPQSTEVPHMVRREDHWWLDANGQWWFQDADGKWWAQDHLGNWRSTTAVSDGREGAWPADGGNGASPSDQNIWGNDPDQLATGAGRHRGGWQHRGRDASREESGRWCQDENKFWCWQDARGTWWLQDGQGNWRSTTAVLDTRTGAWRWSQ